MIQVFSTFSTSNIYFFFSRQRLLKQQIICEIIAIAVLYFILRGVIDILLELFWIIALILIVINALISRINGYLFCNCFMTSNVILRGCSYFWSKKYAIMDTTFRSVTIWLSSGVHWLAKVVYHLFIVCKLILVFLK